MVPSAAASKMGGGGGTGSKCAKAVSLPPAVKAQVVPLHAPPQPTKVEPESGRAVRVMGVPRSTVMVQAPGQSMPEGEEVTRPLPFPVKERATRAFAGPVPASGPPPIPMPASDPPSAVPPLPASVWPVEPVPPSEGTVSTGLHAGELPNRNTANQRSERTAKPPFPLLPGQLVHRPLPAEGRAPPAKSPRSQPC